MQMNIIIGRYFTTDTARRAHPARNYRMELDLRSRRDRDLASNLLSSFFSLLLVLSLFLPLLFSPRDL